MRDPYKKRKQANDYENQMKSSAIKRKIAALPVTGLMILKRSIGKRLLLKNGSPLEFFLVSQSCSRHEASVEDMILWEKLLTLRALLFIP